MLPGYKSLPRIKGEELRQERVRESPEDGLDLARDLDAEEVEARAEGRRLDREAAEHAHEGPDSPR